MHVSSGRPHPAAWAALVLPTIALANNLDCKRIRVDGVDWNLEALGGPHSVSHVQEHHMQNINTTFTFDICQPLKTGPKGEDCRGGTHVCGLERPVDASDTKPLGIIEIAGNYKLSSGTAMSVEYTRLKTLDSDADTQKDGLRMKVGGGKSDQKDQYAIIDFLCLAQGDNEETRRRRRRRLADDESGDGSGGDGEDEDWKKLEEADDGHGGKITFESYTDETNKKGKVEGILRLNWETKYGCESAAEDAPQESRGGWGFFSWFFVILTILLLTYLVFFAWLNYNRYGARGWDLVPHGDTVRDMPYILRDWVRKVVDTIQGGGSRGGYSAV